MTSLPHVTQRYLEQLRPTSFDELIGQQRLTSTLERLVEKSRDNERDWPPVLLVGERGVGKRAIASAIAGELAGDDGTIHWLRPEGESGRRDIDEQLDAVAPGEVAVVEDVHELDADIREQILEAAISPPLLESDRGGQADWTTSGSASSFCLLATTVPSQTEGFSPEWNPVRVRDYNTEELVEIAHWSADRLDIELTETAAFRLARHSRGHARWLKVTVVRILLEHVEAMSRKGNWVVEEWMVDEVAP